MRIGVENALALCLSEQFYHPADAAHGDIALTTEPGPDVAAIHDRQVIVLERPNWQAWLGLEKPEAELLRSLPAGSLIVQQVR